MVEHEQLWAPWRLAYVSGEAAAEARKRRRPSWPSWHCCPARTAIVSSAAPWSTLIDRNNRVVERSELSIVILNRFPYNNGHLLVAPRLHKGRLDEITDAEQCDMQRLIAKYVELIERLMAAQGFNVGLNLGKVAGAGLPGHLHWHIVPRWHGDTNFMPALANLRVIPQALDALWELLHEPDAPADDS